MVTHRPCGEAVGTEQKVVLEPDIWRSLVRRVSWETQMEFTERLYFQY